MMLYSKKLAIKNTLWLFSEKSLAMVLSLMVNVLLARYLAPEQFGQLNFLLSFIALLAPFSALGLNALVTRELVNEPECTGKILATALLLRFLGGLLTALIVFLVFSLVTFKPMIESYWFILAAISTSFTATYIFNYYFQAKVASHYVVKVRLSVLILSSTAKLSAIYFGGGLSWFLSIVLLEPLVTGLSLWFVYRVYDQTHQQQWRFDKDYSFVLLKQSRWLILSGFMSVVYLKIDQLMLGHMVGAVEVGVYAVAVRLSEVWYFFPAAFVASFFPRLLKSRNVERQYKKQLQQLCDCLFWSALLLATVVASVATPVIILLFGVEYKSSALILQIHIWAGVFIFMRALLSKWLIAEGLLPFSLATHGIAAVVNVLLNYYWIPLYGGQGAAWATLISYACSSYLVLWFHNKTRPMAIIMSKTLLAPLRALQWLRLKV